MLISIRSHLFLQRKASTNFGVSTNIASASSTQTQWHWHYYRKTGCPTDQQVWFPVDLQEFTGDILMKIQ